jgi:ADP-heptose:LPS heptosyltransferase
VWDVPKDVFLMAWFGAAKRGPGRILIYRLGSLGDILVAFPALHLVERAFPGSERRLLTSFPPHAKAAPSSAILENTGLIHGYFRYTYGTRSLKELLALWWQLFRWRPDALIYMGGTRSVASAKRDALFFRLCGIRKLIGVPDTEDMQYPRRTNDPVTGEIVLEFEAERLVRNLLLLGDPKLDDPASWCLHLTSTEREKALAVLAPAGDRPVIAVSVGTKMQAKDWGQDNWRALLARLATLYPDHALALCGVKDERATSEFAASGWKASSGAPVINLCGELTPRESGAVFERAVLFIGHDSGPMHLAASVQTPCVAIFASRNIPRVWFPYGRAHRVLYHHVDCEGCNLETCTVQKKKCILSITVEETLAEIQRLLPVRFFNQV